MIRALLAAALIAAAAIAAPPLQPCPTEDAPGPCRWTAALQGNGVGHSFIVTPSGTLIYSEGK